MLKEDAMSIVNNQEHIEAAQEDANKIRANFQASLSTEDKKKFEAVESAVKILVDNGVPFFLFPCLPSPFGDDCWQWNSAGALTKFDEAGVVTKESGQKNAELHYYLAARLFDYICSVIGAYRLPKEEHVGAFLRYVINAVNWKVDRVIQAADKQQKDTQT